MNSIYGTVNTIGEIKVYCRNNEDYTNIADKLAGFTAKFECTFTLAHYTASFSSVN